jgi:hypothetical protein
VEELAISSSSYLICEIYSIFYKSRSGTIYTFIALSIRVHFQFGVAVLGVVCYVYLPTTVGSKSTIIALGTWRPELISLKNVPNEASFLPELSGSDISPLGAIPCSRQYSSQQDVPIWTPAWPT